MQKKYPVVVYKTEAIVPLPKKCMQCQRDLGPSSIVIEDKRESYNEGFGHRKCFLEKLAEEIKEQEATVAWYEGDKNVYNLLSEVIEHITPETDWISVYCENREYILTPAFQDEPCHYCKGTIKKGTLTWNQKCLNCIKLHYLEDPQKNIDTAKENLEVLLHLVKQLTPKTADGIAELLEE